MRSRDSWDPAVPPIKRNAGDRRDADRREKGDHPPRHVCDYLIIGSACGQNASCPGYVRLSPTVCERVGGAPAIRKYRINHAGGLFRPGREKSRLSRGLTKAPFVPDVRYRANYRRGSRRIKLKKKRKKREIYFVDRCAHVSPLSFASKNVRRPRDN